MWDESPPRTKPQPRIPRLGFSHVKGLSLTTPPEQSDFGTPQLTTPTQPGPVRVPRRRMVTIRPLGRLQVHDERSRAFALEPVALPTTPVMHHRRLPIFDQGQLGSCTANAALGMLCTGPLDIGKTWTENDAVAFYSAETRIDDTMGIPGQYPPDDTGSCGLASMKVAKADTWIASYKHAFSVTTALGWLGKQPISIGIPWLNSMFTPGAGALIHVDRHSGVAGGHQICLDGIDPTHSRVRFANSWGASWGDQGWGWFTYADLQWLLGQGGDAVTAILP